MTEVTLHSIAPDGQPLVAIFLPDRGMNLASYRKGEQEVIAQSTWPDFEDRRAGLGALIGPHFHHRPVDQIPPIPHEERFPHIARVKARGVQEPFSHGIGRHAPWRFEASESRIEASLHGEDEWNGVPIADLEGQMFQMRYTAEMKPDGLHLDLSIESAKRSLVGFHTYYGLADGQGTVTAQVQDQYRDLDGWHALPSSWSYGEDQTLTYPLLDDVDFGFQPYPDPQIGKMILRTGGYRVEVSYVSGGDENSWQLWHPKGASFACIEPLSAINPREPILKRSGLQAHIRILD